MDAPALLAAIDRAFGLVPYPGDLAIVANNADWEAAGIRDSFKAYTWHTLPDSLMQYERGGFHFMSPAGLQYYLPAYMQFCVRDYRGSDTSADDLIALFTLPAATDTVPEWPTGDVLAMTSRPLTPDELQERTAWFTDRFSQYDAAQSQAILHYLEYMRDEHGADYWHDEPALAIARYWHQFA